MLVWAVQRSRRDILFLNQAVHQRTAPPCPHASATRPKGPDGGVRLALAAAFSIAALFIYLYVICISLICGKNRITLKYKALQQAAQGIFGRRKRHRNSDNRHSASQPQNDFNRAILPSIAAQLAIGFKNIYR
ncbi:hypothetical protein ACIPEN_07795 [Herbaspirillum chlorophenolicum]|uniref:Transmembrane protein n=1 Tax=Herbaspirillum chlorophenolicum TaxID=211589 RepID=A0ABW8EY08_9BURK